MKLPPADGAGLGARLSAGVSRVDLFPTTNQFLSRSAFWQEIEAYNGTDPLEIWIRCPPPARVPRMEPAPHQPPPTTFTPHHCQLSVKRNSKAGVPH